MSHLVIKLPESLEQQVKESGLSQHQLEKAMTYLLELYLKTEWVNAQIQIISGFESEADARKAGSAKHLGITIADDFDEPLEDFAEYMS